MGPRGQSTFRELMYELPLTMDCYRREKALKILFEQGFENFACYVVGHNVALKGKNGRGHYVRTKAYLLRNESHNDSFLTKAILTNYIHSNDIYKLITHNNVERLQCIPSLSYPVEQFIKIKHRSLWNTELLPQSILNSITQYSIGSDYYTGGSRGRVGYRGPVGPGDDGYGGSWRGASPCMRQFINDPYSLLMALFIRGDRNLIDQILAYHPQLHAYLPGTLELFLIDKTTHTELVQISSYITVPYAYDYAIQHYTGNYNFLKCPTSYQYTNSVYEVDEKLSNIWAG